MHKPLRLILTVIIPLTIGGLIYILFRSDSLKMFRWFDSIGLSYFFDIARHQITFASKIPNWIIFSLPDALWLFSFTNLMLILWDYNFSRLSIFWIILAPLIGLFSELGQAITIIPGTFDFTDLTLLLIATILPFSIINKNKSINIKLV